MRTLTAYGIGVVIVLAVLNSIVWLAGNPQLYNINVFSAGFVLGVLGMYIAAWLYGYRRVVSGLSWRFETYITLSVRARWASSKSASRGPLGSASRRTFEGKKIKDAECGRWEAP